jgi:microsomal epoxide hydrolase
MSAEFKVSVDQSRIDHIVARVKAYPWRPAPADEKESWSRGTHTATLKSLCDHWVTDYDWRAEEAKLNRYPQFLEVIDGLTIHYVHAKGEGACPRPIILTHGWPGSHYEFWRVIERLAYPSRFGGDPDDAFDVVVPSLPGFGFSGKPDIPLGPRATAGLWNTLMTQTLGYDQYIAQGGDLGSLVTAYLGLDHEACSAIHLNMVSLMPAHTSPQSEDERNWLERQARMLQAEGAYMHLHTTKPQTIAMTLADSPVGTAGWILEKIHAWSDLGTRTLEEVYSRNEILTNIMIYLANDAITPSIWFYRGMVEEGALRLAPGQIVDKPTGIANFVREPVFNNPPRSWTQRMFNIVHWTDIEPGGHFAAMEQPDLFARDIVTFARTVA